MINNPNDNELSYLSGANGCLIISDTNAHVGRFYAFVVNTECVINYVYQAPLNDTASEEIKTDLTASTLTANMYIPSGTGDDNRYVFTSIQLTSGSVIAYYY